MWTTCHLVFKQKNSKKNLSTFGSYTYLSFSIILTFENTTQQKKQDEADNDDLESQFVMMPGSVLLQLNYYHRMIMICNPYFNFYLIYFSILYFSMLNSFCAWLAVTFILFLFLRNQCLKIITLLVFSLCLDYVNYFWTALYTQLLCVSIFFCSFRSQ